MHGEILLDWPVAVAKFRDLTTQHGIIVQNDINSTNDLLNLVLLPGYAPFVLASFKPVFLNVLALCVERASGDDFPSILEVFAQIIPVYPAANPLLEHFLLANSQSIMTQTEPAALSRSLRAFHMILSYSRQRYLTYISPELIYSHITSQDAHIRSFAVLLLALYSGASEKLTNSLMEKYVGQAPTDVLFSPLHNARALALATELSQVDVSHEVPFAVSPMSSLVANVGGRLIARNSFAPGSVDTDFHPTDTALVNLRSIVDGLLEEKPILLVGEPGSGKTFYVEYLKSQLRSSEDIIRIHLGDQTDSKSLLGTYSTGDRPGTFEWKEGLLTMAVNSGKWVLIEDLDKAPTDTLSVLLPLLENRELLIPSRNQVIRAKPGFQIFATITRDNHTSFDLIGQRLWYTVSLITPSNDDLTAITRSRFPRLTALVDKLVETFDAVRGAYAQKHTQTRPVTTRDLFKWAARSDALLSKFDVTSEVPTSVYDDIFREAIACLAGFLPDFKTVMLVADLIGEYLEIGSSKVEPILTRHIPAIHQDSTVVTIGRATLNKRLVSSAAERSFESARQNFALTTHSLRLLEQIAVATSRSEALLLVGETGTGKTTVVQYMANLTNQKLIVVNISQQMETGDLVGGFRPLDAKMLAGSLSEDFEELFDVSFSRTKNGQFLDAINAATRKSRWNNVIKLWREAFRLVKNMTLADDTEPAKKKRRLSTQNMREWADFMAKVDLFELRLEDLKKSILFQFIEGLLVKAVRKGYWILLDEINLAPADTLESVADLLVTPPSLTLLEKGGDPDAVVKGHPDFRLFACMNPATDVGKRDLPPAVRSRFTEIYVDSPDRNIEDLRFIIEKYIGRYRMNDQHVVNDVAELYLSAKKLAEDNLLVDGAGQRPHFSIRTLTRTLLYSTSISKTYGLRRALYEGFAMSFSTLLDKESSDLLETKIRQHILERLGNIKSVLATLPPKPDDGNEYIQFRHYWLRKGELNPIEDPSYIITPSVERNLLNLVRATATKRFPVLIQGPTSSGKTSMINYLAKHSGHGFVRINNHEHTDLQEYVGTYVSDENGAYVFQEGVLVEAMRKGYWIVLDELNLAPTDVLEALNRLLDDNRELLIPETQEVVKPHPDFMLFATQNPPGLYAGRKVLSRAFRNRFLELHFDDIPQDELEVILRDRSQIAPSYAKRIVEAYRELSRQRQSTRVFEQKNSFATLRDLFRWANREAVGYEQLALNGYFLLCERVRNEEEKRVVAETLERVMKVKLNVDYNSMVPANIIAESSGVVWTNAMKRLLVLVHQAMAQNEPILLVGETGSGKTTIFQVLAQAFKKELHIINAHQNMETGDIIGSQRPVRNRPENQHKLSILLSQLYNDSHSSLSDLIEVYKTQHESVSQNNAELCSQIDTLLDSADQLFEWVDGSLVTALKDSSFFLFDEISLADDSVLERLNSVLEPERTLLLPEKGGRDILVVGADGFQFFATMNPGGDYGKKELSPALRNRFTEIWVPSLDSFDDVEMIVRSKLDSSLQQFSPVIVRFSHWFASTFGNGDASSGIISLRDILNWVQFVNIMTSKDMSASEALFHGACMVFVDSIGSNNMAHLAQSDEILAKNRLESVTVLSEMIDPSKSSELQQEYFNEPIVKKFTDSVALGKFHIALAADAIPGDPFSLNAPTTAMNAMRLARAMHIPKPILLEGSPGVGKTSLVSAIASVSGHKLIRINFSDQTDLTDLFGSDTPVEGQAAGEFTWRDAPFLRAMQTGDWVLLDEMNLAPQPVLEGLNSCLDHRAEVYIPELDRSFKCHPNFRVFAAQNPQYQGGGRKGLPKSFVNRFSVVYVDSLTMADLHVISSHLYPSIASDVREKVVNFVQQVQHEVAVVRSFGHSGSPFEFNLRDTLRWFKLAVAYDRPAEEFFDMIVRSRFRTAHDREYVTKLFQSHFGPDSLKRTIDFSIGPDYVQSGHSYFERSSASSYSSNPLIDQLQCNNSVLEATITAVQQAWPVILVGPSDSGKTSFLRYLAFIHGAVLKELSINADVDSSDLLGEFDQVEDSQQLARVWNEVDLWLHLNVDQLGSRYVAISQAAVARDLEKTYGLLKLDPAANAVVDMIEKYHTYDFSKPRFQWFDGVLVQAIENGYWVVLDNANLCNPSVLDRLNSLLEPNGSLLINECSEASGEPRKVTPHANFRMFLTSNPKYGELSRAMRNRGVEIYLDELSVRATNFDRKTLHRNLGNKEATDIDELEPQLKALQLRPQKPSIVSFIPAVNSQIREISLYCERTFTDSEKLHWLAGSFFNGTMKHLLTNNPLPTDESFVSLFSLFRTLSGSTFESYYTKLSEFLTVKNVPSVLLESRITNPISGEFLFSFKAHIMRHAIKEAVAHAIAMDSNLHQLSPLQQAVHNRQKGRVQITDIYSFVMQALEIDPTADNAVELFDLLADFVALVASVDADPSRIPIYRDMFATWLESTDGSHDLKLASLGRALKFESHGSGMERLWSGFGHGGFISEQNWVDYCKLSELANNFDDLSSQFFTESIQEVFSIREALAAALSDAHSTKTAPGLIAVLTNGIAKIEDNLLKAQETRHAFFAPAFDSLASLVKVAFFANPSLALRRSLTRLAHFTSSTHTIELASMYDDLDKSLVLPSVPVDHFDLSTKLLAVFGQIDAVPSSQQESASLEIRTLVKELFTNSRFILQNKLSDLQAMLTARVALLSQAIPEADVSHIQSLLTGLVNPRAISDALVAFSQLLFDLYVPTEVYDPAIRQHVKYARYLSQKAAFDKDVHYWTSVRGVFVSDAETAVDELLLQQRDGLDAQPVPSVYRPERSQAELIYRDVNAVRKLLSPDYYLQLDHAGLELWNNNVEHFLRRLKAYGPYEDLVGLMKTAVSGLKLGLNMRHLATESSQSLHWLIDPLAISFSGELSANLSASRGLQASLGPRATDKINLQLLRICSLHNYSDSYPVIEESLAYFYRNWSMERLREEEKAREDASVFKYSDVDAEEEAEKDFARLFPDFEGDVPDSKISTDIEQHYELLNAYLALFSDSKSPLLSSIVKQSAKTLSSMELPSTTAQLSNYRVLPGIVLGLLERVAETVTAPEFNFYSNSHYSEARRAIDISRLVSARVNLFLARWPEHDTLLMLKRACEELVALPVSAPLARFLAKIEQIYHILSEWQRFASKEVAVLDLLTSVSELIVSWRRLELSTWPSLFSQEDLATKKAGSKYWFYLYENLISNPVRLGHESMDYTEIVKTLILFVSESTFGQFESRIQLLLSFHRQLVLMADRYDYLNRVATCVKNVVGFYEQYSHQVSAQIAAHVKVLTKEIQEVILLASWRDVNVLALKQSAQRSHRALYKIVRKYRDFVNRSVSQIVESEAEKIQASFTASSSLRLTLDVDAHAHLLKEDSLTAGLWAARPSHLHNFEKRAEFMMDYADQVSSTDISSLATLAKTSVSEAERLRNLTPKTLTKDNTKLVSSLRVEKLQLLTSVLKSLKEAGMRTSVRADTMESQSVLTEVMAGTPHFDSSSDFGCSNVYFYRIIELLPRLRSAVVSSESDVPASDLRRGLAYGENLVHSLLGQRKIAQDSVVSGRAFIESLNEKVSGLSALLDSNDQAVVLTPACRTHMTQSLNLLAIFPEFTSAVIESGNQYGESNVDISSILSSFGFGKDRISIPTVVTHSWAAGLSEIHKSLLKFSTAIDGHSATHSNLISPLVSDLAEALTFTPVFDDITPSATVEDIDAAVIEVCNSVLVVIQTIIKAINVVVPEDDWFIHSQNVLKSAAASLHVSKISERFSKVTEMISLFARTNTKVAAAYMGSLLPFIAGYKWMIDAVALQLSRHLFDNTQATYLLLRALYSLASEGLCSPQPPSEGEEDTSNMQDGTGLGDGEGAQSNSKDEEQDEDLTEQAQTENKEQQERDPDEEDNAVEMEGDMAGNLEDADLGSDDEEKEDQEEQEEMDDEVGDIDDLDPNAVDEKMWDDKKEDSTKEKDTDENVKGEEDDLQANDNEDEAREGDNKDSADNNDRDHEDDDIDNDQDDDEGLGEQEDNVNQADKEELEEGVEEKETLELPEDMNLDGEDDEGGEEQNDAMDDAMDGGIDDEEEKGGDEADEPNPADIDAENLPEGEEQEDVDESMDPENDENADEDPTAASDQEMEEAEEADAADDRDQPKDTSRSKEDIEDAMDLDTEGLHGPEDHQDETNMEQSTLAEPESNVAGEGANQDTAEEQDAVDVGETATSAMDSELQPQEEKIPQEAKDSLKELGDAMKEFYNREREIKERSEIEEEQKTEESANIKPDEVQHVGSEDKYDSQAIGKANEQEHQDIDQDMAIDEEEEEVDEKPPTNTEQFQDPANGGAGEDSGEPIKEEPEDALDSMVGNVGETKEIEIDESQSDIDAQDDSDDVEEQLNELSESRELWRAYDLKTHGLTLILTEQLRLILEPTLATKLRGDYKTGKRLNMKRIIPYIASQFKKDKIWLRRSKPSKRQYQVMLAIDDSKSMGEPIVTDLAFQAIALVSKALTQVEAGQLAIARFGSDTSIVHPFDKPFNQESGARALQYFKFDQPRTNVERLLNKSLDYFEQSRATGGPSEKWQLEIIISDGILEDQDKVRRLVRQAHDNQVMVVFIVLDAINKDGSILDMNQVNYIQDANGNMSLQVDSYMDKFPFEYYVLVRNINDLPHVLASVLRQYFQAVE